MKQSAWYCLRIASTVGSRGPTALWQKAQMSAGGDEGRGWPRCPQLGTSLHHPPAHLWSRPSPGARWHPATAVCLLAPGEIWAASAQQGRRKEPGEQEANVRYVEALEGGETEAWG